MIRTLKAVGGVLAVLLCSVSLSACEEKVTRYEPGKYSGAPVTSPWESPQYSGKKADWEAAIEARTQAQNDYARMGRR